MIRLIYTIRSKNLTNEDFHEVFSANDAKFLGVKNKKIAKTFIFRVKKNAETHKYLENFPKMFMMWTAAYIRLKLTSISSNWFK